MKTYRFTCIIYPDGVHRFTRNFRNDRAAREYAIQLEREQNYSRVAVMCGGRIVY